jgi:hypothetical protein
MKRRNFIVGGLVASSSTLLSCSTETEVNQEYGPIVHSVFFWLKADISEEDKENFVNFFEALREIPEVQTLRYGKPAATNPRPVVDHSFTYNLLVTFANIEAINVYETHPIHLDAIEKYKHLWTKVLVMDTMLQ